MQLTFNTYKLRTEKNGNSFLDLELILVLTPEKSFRLKIGIPATINKDLPETFRLSKNPESFDNNLSVEEQL